MLSNANARDTNRLFISINNSERARFDQSAFAVMWKNTTWPSPIAMRVTNGVPSDNSAITREDRSASGSARTCAFTTISSGISNPKKGLWRENGASCFGVSHVIAPPSCRPPCRNRTGINSDAPKSTVFNAVVGPANCTNVPPFVTQLTKSASLGRRDTSVTKIAAGLDSKISSKDCSTISAFCRSAVRK